MFSKSINRLTFALRWVFSICIGAIGSTVKDIAVERSLEGKPDSISLTLSVVGLLLLIFALVYLIRFTFLARCRDAGIHGAYILLLFIPFMNLIFTIAMLMFPSKSEALEPVVARQ